MLWICIPSLTNKSV